MNKIIIRPVHTKTIVAEAKLLRAATAACKELRVTPTETIKWAVVDAFRAAVKAKRA